MGVDTAVTGETVAGGTDETAGSMDMGTVVLEGDAGTGALELDTGTGVDRTDGTDDTEVDGMVVVD